MHVLVETLILFPINVYIVTWIIFAVAKTPSDSGSKTQCNLTVVRADAQSWLRRLGELESEHLSLPICSLNSPTPETLKSPPRCNSPLVENRNVKL